MKTIKKPRLSEVVAKEIRKDIQNEHLTHGDRLPTVSELMATFGIGRSTLREALQLLESQGVLEVLNGKGIFVKDVKPFHIQTAFEVEDEKKFLLEALDVRMAIEGKAVNLAASKATNEEISKMELHLKEYAAYIKSGQREKANYSDAMFHQTIYDAAKNELLTSIISSVWDTFDKFWSEPFGVEDIFDPSYPYHHSLLEAIREKDAAAANAAFEMIMESVKTAIQNVE